MSPGDGHVTLFIIALIVKPLIALSVIGLLIAVFAVKSKHGRWFAWPAKSLIALICIVTLDIPLKLASLAIHCAFWTGLHVEPGKVLQPLYDPHCGRECVEALVSNEDAVFVQTATIPMTQWEDGETRDQQFKLSKDNEYRCREYWRVTVRAAADAGLDTQPDPSLCLLATRIAGTERSALYERVDEVNQTNPGSIFWLTYKRGFDVWDIQAERMIAWFRGYEIRLSWLYPLELGCPANRDLLNDRDEVVLEAGRLVRP